MKNKKLLLSKYCLPVDCISICNLNPKIINFSIVFIFYFHLHFSSLEYMYKKLCIKCVYNRECRLQFLLKKCIKFLHKPGRILSFSCSLSNFFSFYKMNNNKKKNKNTINMFVVGSTCVSFLLLLYIFLILWHFIVSKWHLMAMLLLMLLLLLMVLLLLAFVLKISLW